MGIGGKGVLGFLGQWSILSLWLSFGLWSVFSLDCLAFDGQGLVVRILGSQLNLGG